MAEKAWWEKTLDIIGGYITDPAVLAAVTDALRSQGSAPDLNLPDYSKYRTDVGTMPTLNLPGYNQANTGTMPTLNLPGYNQANTGTMPTLNLPGYTPVDESQYGKPATPDVTDPNSVYQYKEFDFKGVPVYDANGNVVGYNKTAPQLTLSPYEKFTPKTELSGSEMNMVSKIFSPMETAIQGRAKQAGQRAVGASAARGGYGSGSAASAINSVRSLAAKENQSLLSEKTKAVLARLDYSNQLGLAEHQTEQAYKRQGQLQSFQAAQQEFNTVRNLAASEHRTGETVRIENAWKSYSDLWNRYQTALQRGDQQNILKYQSEVNQAKATYDSELAKWKATQEEGQFKYGADVQKAKADYDSAMTKWQTAREEDRYKYQSEVDKAKSQYDAELNKWQATQRGNEVQFKADTDKAIAEYNAKYQQYADRSAIIGEFFRSLQQRKSDSEAKEIIRQYLGDKAADLYEKYGADAVDTIIDAAKGKGGGAGNTAVEAGLTAAEVLAGTGTAAAAGTAASAATGTAAAGTGAAAAGGTTGSGVAAATAPAWLTGLVSTLGIAAPIAATIYAIVNRPRGAWKDMAPEELAIAEYVKFLGGKTDPGQMISELEQQKQGMLQSGMQERDPDQIADIDRQIANLKNTKYATQFTPQGHGGRALSADEVKKFLAMAQKFGLPTQDIAPTSARGESYKGGYWDNGGGQ